MYIVQILGFGMEVVVMLKFDDLYIRLFAIKYTSLFAMALFSTHLQLNSRAPAERNDVCGSNQKNTPCSAKYGAGFW